jgi:hypothetical protein
MPSDASSPSGPHRLLRAAGAGLCGGMLLGGVLLLYLGLKGWLSPPDCTGLLAVECDFLTQATQEMGRRQLLFGGALLALALASFVLMRPYFRSDEPQQP